MVDNLMIVSGKIRFWTTSPGQSMNKPVDDLLTPAPTSVNIPGHILRMKCICVHLNQGFLLLQVFNSYYKSSFVIYVCMFKTYCFFHFKTFNGDRGTKSRFWGLSECSHKGVPDLVWKLNLEKLSVLSHSIHEIPKCAFDKLQWAARDIASSSSCSVELHTLIPLPTMKGKRCGL